MNALLNSHHCSMQKKKLVHSETILSDWFRLVISKTPYNEKENTSIVSITNNKIQADRK